MKVREKYVGHVTIKTWVILLTVIPVLFLPSHRLAIAQSTGVTEKEIRDAILGRIELDLDRMDLNDDGKVDVSDVVYFLRTNDVANFLEARSEIDETCGICNVVVNFSRPFTGILRYTIGGTATENEDYSALTGLVEINGRSATIQVAIISDTVFEGNETIELSLLTSMDYLLGMDRTHTITLRDNPFESSADYIFILSTETLGVEGDTTNRQGFPPTLFSRTASVNITLSHNDVLNAMLNVAKSIGISDTVTGANTIPAASVSYSSGTLEMVFEYGTQSESFVSDPAITSFDPDNPSLGVQNEKRLTSILTLRVNDFDISTEKFTNKFLQGTYSLSMLGVLNEGTVPFFHGRLVATMQQ